MPSITALLAAVLVCSAVAIAAWLGGTPAAGWVWVLWVLAFAALMGRIFAALAGRSR